MNKETWAPSHRSCTPLAALDITGTRFISFDLVVFLDFDGVLHHPSADSCAHFDKASFLAKALYDADPEASIPIVISSNWRLTRSLESLRFALPGKIAERVIGVTPDLMDSSSAPAWNNGNAPSTYRVRQQEIEMWMSTYAPAGTWLALDDIASGFEENCQSLIHIASTVRFSDSPGLNESHSDLLVQKLNERTRKIVNNYRPKIG